MNREAFIKYVKELEAKQSKNPLVYKLWVVWLIVSFFLYISMMIILGLVLLALAIILLVSGPYVTLFPGILGSILLFFGVTSLFRILLFRYEKPEGLVLEYKDAPALFDRITEISRALNTPVIHQVLLNADFNAAAAQVPQAGIFGFYRNTVIIGIPFLLMFDRKHFDAVLAHELAHISKYHGRMGCWIAKIAGPMLKIMQSSVFFNAFGGSFLRRFQFWFMNRLSASTLVLNRANEVEAQRLAAKVAGEQAVVDCYALTHILISRLQNALWQSYYRISAEREDPAPVIPHMEAVLSQTVPVEWAEKTFAFVKNTVTEYNDSHPAYSDIVNNLGVAPEMPQFPVGRVFDQYCNVSELSAKFEEYWKETITHTWHCQRRIHQDRKARFDAALARTDRTEGDLLRMADYTLVLSGEEAALPLYREILQKNAFQPDAAFQVGMDELWRYEAAGVDKVRHAIQRNIKYFGRGFQAVRGYYLGMDKTREAQAYADSQKKNEELYQSFLVHQNSLSDDMVYGKADLDERIVCSLRECVAGSSLIRKAYLTKKGKRGEREVYVIVLVWSASKGDKRIKKKEEAVRDIMSVMECHEADIIIRTNKDFYMVYYRTFKKLFCIRLK